MDSFHRQMDEMLTTAYRSIWKVEEVMLRHMSNSSLSLSEMHMLESIGKMQGDATTITDVAQDLDITLPSVTAMVKRLEKKGYVRKEKSAEDKRTVKIVLTTEGRRAETAHRYYHRRMVRAITRDMNQQEKDAVLSGLSKMIEFRRLSVEEYACGRDDEA